MLATSLPGWERVSTKTIGYDATFLAGGMVGVYPNLTTDILYECPLAPINCAQSQFMLSWTDRTTAYEPTYGTLERET